MKAEILIRIMSADDIDNVMEVEHNAFSMPWSRRAFENEMYNNQFAHYLVAEVGGRIVGYCGVWIVIDEAHVTNIAVHSRYRGRKIGQELLANLMELAYTYGARTMTLEVRETNETARNLYDKFGFVPGGVRKNYYMDNNENAIVMWVNMNERA
ncbi:[SSU ribosomal protein S18P]-alanine acetyltransferase [Marinococcus luteus]|uniref:[Ribosomal protein bS18]-alanine N-acetyltransferase n=1 Tax=Marinococcus luteus TaxID=1122204 RepID=A0A1H2Y6P7_9BACI|nr:ribosomal protein S18-alanine N-acetyltransferase [Marinococcus luteus]SDX00817.1 [SSU ribosomal protein S18P]-alanine acetyltransferase [Marinococcus luteus]